MVNDVFFKIPIAHRGITSTKNKILPNTLEACKNALDKNIPFEIDVRMTRDNNLIVMHGIYVLFENNELKHYKKINDFDIDNKYINNSKCKIPRLEQVLNEVQGKVPILLDIKFENIFDKRKIEKLLKKVLSTYSGDIFIHSFFCCLKKISHIKRGIVLPFFPKLSNIILKIFDYDFICVNCNMLDVGLAIKLKKTGNPVLLWNYEKSKHNFFKKYLNANIIVDITEEDFIYLNKID